MPRELVQKVSLEDKTRAEGQSCLKLAFLSPAQA